MYISRIYVDGFKSLVNFDLPLRERVNVIVGDNETGKSSLLEAIGLVLTHKYDGRVIDYVVDPYMFNAGQVANFFERLRNGQQATPPRILIEAYIESKAENPLLACLKGTNNTKNENSSGLKLLVELKNDHTEELKEYAIDESNPTILPVEFYKCEWQSFANNGVKLKNLPFRAKLIDTSLPRSYHGPNKYVSQVVDDVLDEQQRRHLSLAYKKLRHNFAQQPGVASINSHLEKKNQNRRYSLSVQVDMSSRSSWDNAITAHLDNLPFDCAGKGEQCRVQMQLAIADAEMSKILLIEEPENHLSHSNLNTLMNEITVDAGERQIIVTTHSAFVLNKLGIDALTLISSDRKTARLTQINPDTQDYFKKLPGFDTLRLILARTCILVEGPSDELIVQRAFFDLYGKLPLEVGVDVISVGALAFKRFLEIAALLNLTVAVVTDNDGDVKSLQDKYKDYIGTSSTNIKICFDGNESLQTLEPQLLFANSLAALNAILEKNYVDGPSLLKYMDRKKTECALKLFETESKWNAPKYIAEAIGHVIN